MRIVCNDMLLNRVVYFLLFTKNGIRRTVPFPVL